jgi:hypothetical protein
LLLSMVGRMSPAGGDRHEVLTAYPLVRDPWGRRRVREGAGRGAVPVPQRLKHAPGLRTYVRVSGDIAGPKP